MGRRRAEQQRAASIGELRTLFDEIDADCSGELERHEIRSLVTRLGQDASEQDVDAAMAAMDKDGDGVVDFDEFCGWWRTRDNTASGGVVDRLADRMQSLRSTSHNPALEAQVLYCFELLDADSSGRLDSQEVAQAAKKLGAEMTPEESAGMFAEMEKGPDGEVGFHAFRRWYLEALSTGRVPPAEVPATPTPRGRAAAGKRELCNPSHHAPCPLTIACCASLRDANRVQCSGRRG